MILPRPFAGILRRPDGKTLAVLGCGDIDGKKNLHVQGAVVDFWATPAQLYHRRYRLFVAKPAIWDAWSLGVYGRHTTSLLNQV